MPEPLQVWNLRSQCQTWQAGILPEKKERKKAKTPHLFKANLRKGLGLVPGTM